MLQTWGPLVITLCYTLVACILGFSAKGRLDMSKVENWSSSGNTMGLIVMVFLTGAGNVSAYTFLGAPGWAYSKGVAALYVVVYLGFIPYFTESKQGCRQIRLQDPGRGHRSQI